MNTKHANEMNNTKSTMMGSLIDWVSRALRRLWGRAGNAAAEQAEATTAPTPITAMAPERKCVAAGNAQPHREHAKSKNRPWHPRAFRPRESVNRKPTYRPVASGATFLVDTANLIGAIGPEHAASRLTNLREMMACAGHSVVFFWEHGAYTWTKAQQETESEKQALSAFVARDDVSLVSGESDLAILQAAQVTPNSICLTRDHYRDYAETYPQIVGSARHRSFSVAKIAGMLTLSVIGLKDAIVLSKDMPHAAPSVHAHAAFKTPVSMVASVEKAPDADDVIAKEKSIVQKSLAPARRAGLSGCVDARLAAGDGRTAVKLLAQIARQDPSAYGEMARIYEEGDGLTADARASKHYARLAKKEMKAARQTARRQKRLVANCATGLDYANLHGAENLLLAQKLEQCAQRKAEGRKFQRRTSHKRTGHAARAFRYAA